MCNKGTANCGALLTDNKIIQYEYDDKGNPILVTQVVCIPSGKVVKDKGVARYTAEGKLSKTVTCSYDENGKLINKEDKRYP